MTALELFLSVTAVLVLITVTIGAPPDCDIPAGGKKVLTLQQKYHCLVQELFDPEHYSPLLRPVGEVNTTVQVNMSVQLSQIVDIDERNQVMKTNVWLQLYWYDYQLLWDANRGSKYENVTTLRMRPDLVWTPDIVLFNNADGNYEVSYRSNVIVYNTGFIAWIPPAIYKSSCSMDVQFFPFDEQQCDLTFGSWTFLDYQLDIYFYKKVQHLDVSDYLPSGAWDIVSGNAKRVKIPSAENGQNKTMVVFEIVIRRKALFYTINLIIPCSLISFVTLSVFILPADAGEKIAMCILILLALVVFLLLISKILPPSLTIPLISQYLLFMFIINILVILCTVIVINRNYRTPRTHQMPYWVRLIFLNYLPKLLFLTRPDHDERWTDNLDKQPDVTFIVNPTVANGNNRETDTRSSPVHTYREATHRQVNRSQRRTSRSPLVTAALVMPEVIGAAESVKFIHRHYKKDDEYRMVIDDWRYVARVMDRFLLILFVFVTSIGTISLFLQAPHIFERINQEEILDVLNRAWAKALTSS